jgi:undecaprenyl diphosphate synthase
MELKKLAHLAIIMDGNGRWAKINKLPLIEGYRQGVSALRSLIESSIKLNIKYLTVFAFSAENWNRNQEEVQMLMDLVRYYVEKELPSLLRAGVKLKIIGEGQNLPNDIQKVIENAELATQNNTKLQLTVALNYGGQQEIIKATKEIAQKIVNKEINMENIDVQYFANSLYTADLPNLDLLIRTSGEMRLSNFLLWQSAYAELYFTDTLWPDFNHQALIEAINCYNKRERRYGRSNFQKIKLL